MPIQNPGLRADREDDGCVMFLIPRRDTSWVKVLDKLLVIPKYRRIGLDEIGTYVWDMCDGQTTVRTMIRRFSKKYKLNRKEAEVSMVAYLKQLAKKGIVAIQVPQEALEEGGKKT